MAAKAAQAPKEDAKAVAKAAKRRARTERANSTQAEGSIGLVDSSGLKWFMNTNITFATTSSASGAMSEASYTTSVTATTSGGGTTTSTLNNAYDGYQTICVSFTGQTGPCSGSGAPELAPVKERGEGGPPIPPPYIFYNQTGGPPTPDGSCGNRQYIFPLMTVNGLQIYRKVFVPSADSFARWLNIFTNTNGAPLTFNMITANNLGSDSNTKIVTSTNGDAVADVTDTWVTSFQNYSGNTSTAVRLGHVFQGPGGALGLSNIFFADGNDRPYWTYTITLAPGETKIIMNYGVGQPTNAKAAAKSAELASLGSSASTSCMSGVELTEVANFAAQGVAVPAVSPVGLALLGLGLAVLGFVVVRRLS